MAAKIISLTTRRVLDEGSPIEEQIGEGEGASVEEPQVDTDTLESVEQFAEMVKTGNYSGCLIIGWNQVDRCFFSDLVLPEDDHPDISAAKFIGFMRVVEGNLAEIIQSETVMASE